MFLLEPVGLGRVENDVYLALLDLGRATTDEVAARVGQSADITGTAIDRLAEAGLVEGLGLPPTVHVAVCPDEALSALIDRKRGQLAAMQLDAEKLAGRLRATSGSRGAPLVELVEGEDAVLAAITRLQVRAREEIIAIGAPPYIGGQASPSNLQLARLADGITYRFLYSRESLSSPEHVKAMRRCVEAGEQARILPGVGKKMMIADRATALLPASFKDPAPDVRLLVRESSLVEVLVCLFEYLWSRSTPVDAPQSPAELSARDRELLSLLASGMKDRTIARALGVTERTVGRRLTELMTALGAETRFQAGIQAVRRGWL
ncbi:helix-turn-helix domain-containing protein [Streptomyces sp. NPDC057101]|uniref:helix-turn-helix domain-containing protein n=1 Tax=Streptomyces sp. NPDC057101 TaxID=3346020 RepID=UPI00362F6EA1